MDFWKTVLVLVRRWYVAVPALLISLGLAGMAFQSIPPKYASTGSVILLTPTQGASATNKDGPVNPLLNFGGSLEITAQLLTQVLLSQPVAAQLATQGATADYEVGDADTGGPFINVVATGRSPSEAQRTVVLVLARARQELVNRQNALNAPRTSYIKVEDAVLPNEATKLNGNRFRGAGAALALGLAASLGAAFMVESLVEHRRERRGLPGPSRRMPRRPQSGLHELRPGERAGPPVAPPERGILRR